MKSLFIRIPMLAVMGLVFAFTAFGQTRCERDYTTCVRACDATRDQTVNGNNLRRTQIRLQLSQDLLDCNIRFQNDAVERRSCRNETTAVANAALAVLDGSNLQAERDRLSCINECSRRLRECQRVELLSGPTVTGGFTVDCLNGGAPCRGAVSEFCTMAASTCDDCWRSLCGGGEWLIDSEVPLRSVTLVAVSDTSKSQRVLATSSIKGKRAILKVPRDLKLKSGEQLYFQFRSRTKPNKAVKLTIHREGR